MLDGYDYQGSVIFVFLIIEMRQETDMNESIKKSAFITCL